MTSKVYYVTPQCLRVEIVYVLARFIVFLVIIVPTARFWEG